jgi:epoxyqueuosine reductase QueG
MTLDVVAVLRELYEADPDKRLDDAAGSLLFDPPLVATADATDPWFSRWKDVIGAFHWTAQEALALTAPSARARSVICWCLPVGETARKANREAVEFPSRAWAYARTMADRILSRMEQGLEQHLRVRGHAAIAPAGTPQDTVEPATGVRCSTRWSQRHVAFVAGLGTFGISGGLITVRGVAHRLGSVVTSAAIEPTARPYGDDPFAWCLRSSRGTCGACIARCPAGSIGQTVNDRNKQACSDHSRRVRQRGAELYGWDGTYGCGLCQTGVPCEFRNPTTDTVA